MTTLLILGATGLVGKQLLQQALANERITHIIAPTRRVLPEHLKLENPLVDFQNLPTQASWWHVDAAVCALGSTIAQAGSQEAFYKVDHDFVLAAAQLLHSAGTPCFVLNSSLGAKIDGGSFYLRVKGQTERDLAALNFTSLTIVRPSLLDGGKRPEKRYGEQAAIFFSRLLEPLIPRRLRPVSTALVAGAMLRAALVAPVGAAIIESDALHEVHVDLPAG
jgi:uncharacterized protein YbjT (DUF2867 family)